MAFVLAAFGAIGRFFAAVFTWLSKNPGIMISMFIALAFLMLLVSKNHEIAGLNKAAVAAAASHDRLTAALTTERNNTASLKSGLDDANNALGLLQTKATQAQSAYQQIIAGQAAANSRLDGKLANIANAKSGPDKCASALALIKGTVQ